MIKRALLCLAIASTTLAADVQERLRDNESRQQELRSQVASVGEQLDAVLGEFDRNGIGGGPDTTVLRQIRGVLDKLSAEQMQKVVEYLQTAQSAKSADVASASVRDAHAQQQIIVGQLGKLLLEFQRQQGIQGLAARFEKLADRQHLAMNATVKLALSTNGKPANNWHDEQKNTQQMGRNEQDGINADAKEAFDMLTQLAATDGGGEGDGADQLRKAQALVQDRTLPKQMADASDAISQASLYRAATAQKFARDSFYDLADLIAPPKDKADALRDAKETLERLADLQKAAQDQAAQAHSPDDKTDAQQAQAALVDKTDRVEHKLAELASSSAGEAKAAEKAMIQARADMAKNDKEGTKQQQTAAIDQLKKAAAALDEEIAKADAIPTPPTPPQDKLEAAKELAEKATQLQKDQQAATAQAKTDPAKAADLQKQVTEKAADLQKQAAAQDESAAAAPDLGEAAKQSDQAKAELAAAKTPDAKAPDAKTPDAAATPPTAQPASADQAKAPDAPKDAAAQAATAQAAAQKAIDAAVAKLQQQAKDMQAKADELANAQDAKEAVDNVMKAQEAQNQMTDDAAAAKQSATDQAKPQTDIAQQASAAADKAAAAAPAAQQAMQNANSDMQQAAAQLGKDQAPAAQAPQKDAVANLQKASTALDQKIADLQKDLGQTPDSPQDQNADAQQALTDAQQKTDAAAGDMKQNQPADAAGQMQQAAAGLQKAAAQDGKAPGDAKAAMQAAAGALQQAAGQAKAGQGQQAQASMGQAQQQMAAAAASLSAQASAMGMNKSQMANSASKAKADEAMKGMTKSTKQSDGARASHGPTGGAVASGQQAYVGLPQRDRQALMQSQSDKYPQEFAPDIERYLRNLSDTDKK